jgi:type II secretory pathway component PulK
MVRRLITVAVVVAVVAVVVAGLPDLKRYLKIREM